MYHKFYGLTDAPFRITPDPRFLYLGPAHREALATLIYGIRERKGLVALTGGVGTGKTTLLEGLFERLAGECVFVRIRDPRADFTAIVRELLAALGIPSHGVDRTAAMQLLWERLSAPDAATINPTLVIDEAQDVRDEVLEDFRLLSNLETHDRKLIQMLLVGQPEFRRRLEAPGLEALRQRIALSTTLHPLTLSECTAYVKHRLAVAGAEPDGIFAIGAFEAIHDYARGIPRLINVVCDGALSMGYATGTRPIHAGLVREVVQDLRGEGAPLGAEPDGARPSRAAPAAAPRRTRAAGGAWVAAAGVGSVLVLVGALAGPRLHALGRRHTVPGPQAALPTPRLPESTPPAYQPPPPEADDTRSARIATEPRGASPIQDIPAPDAAPLRPAAPAEPAPSADPVPAGAALVTEPSASRATTNAAPTRTVEPPSEPFPSASTERDAGAEPVLDGVPDVREDARAERNPARPQPSGASAASARTAPSDAVDAEPDDQRDSGAADRLRERGRQAKLAKDLAREKDKARAKEKEKEKAAAKALADRKSASRLAEAANAPESRGQDIARHNSPGENGGEADSTSGGETAALDSEPSSLREARPRLAPSEPNGARAATATRPEAKMFIVPDAPEASQPVAPSLRMKELYASHKLGAAEPSPRFVPGDTVNLVAMYELANVSGGGTVSIDLWVRGPNQEDLPALGARREIAARAGTFQAAVARRIPANAPSGVYGLVARVSHGGVESRRVFLFRVD